MTTRETTPRHDQFDRRKHPCGCVTFFDVAAWQSVVEVSCNEHERFMQPGPASRQTTLGALTAADLGKQVEVGIRFGASVVGLLWRVEHRPDGTRVVLGTDYEMVVTDEPDTPVTVYDEEEA